GQYIGLRAPKLADTLNNLGNTIGEMITDLPKSLDFSTFEGMGSMVGNIASVIISIIMCILSAYFFIADREWVGKFMDSFMPENITHKYDVFASSIKQAVGGYFKAQFRIEIWMYVLLLAGLTFMKVRYSFLIALLMAFLDFLPFFGTGIVLVPWVIVTIIGGNISGLLVSW
ncbi:MAG: AI-2E family transporter, partial [Lachnospiraceae bacterium]|nr:AI-2E family transporter [Lachnospiraceae bacterium]